MNPLRPQPSAADLEQERLLIADLQATFAGIFARPLREYGPAWSNEVGVWTGGDSCMPDGSPIFYTLACPDPHVYNGRVHEGFERWLELRGWVVEDYDGETFHIVLADGDGADLVPTSAASSPAAEGCPS